MKYEKILLLKVPYCSHPDDVQEDTDFRTKAPFRPVPSLALAVLCAFLEKYNRFGYGIEAVDVNIEAYTKPGEPIDISVYETILEGRIKNSDYEVLALSSMFVFNVKWVDKAIRLSRKYHPSSKIILGGGYPTLFPERCLKEHDVDDVIIGEGEAAMIHLVNRYNGNKDEEFEKRFPFGGYGHRQDDGTFKIVPRAPSFLDTEDLLAPAWHYLNVEKYFKNSGDRVLSIEGSRGCPYRCTYCCTYLSWGRRVRYKSVPNLVREIKDTVKAYSPAGLHFVDDNLAFSKEWFKAFLNELIKLKLPVRIDASNFSVKHVDEEILDLLIGIGMDRISLAVETGSAEIQRSINKNLDFGRVREVVNMIKAKGLKLHLCWMLGFPNETMGQINSTFDLARKLRANSNQFLTVLPYPGTEMFEQAKAQGLLVFTAEDLSKFDNRKCDYLKSEEWDYERLQQMIYDVNIELNFLNNPLLDTDEGRLKMLDFVERLLLRLPEHVIARMVAGYIENKRGNTEKCAEHYKKAEKLLGDRNLRKTFAKYLAWDHPIVNEFKRTTTRNYQDTRNNNQTITNDQIQMTKQ